MKLCIDPEFEAINPPPTSEERAQLEVNLLADGVRDAFAVWAGEPPIQMCRTCPPGTPFSRASSDIETEKGTVVWRCQGCGHVEHRPWILLDGHTRYPIVTTHNVPFEIAEVKGVQTREEAVNWIINHQLGRRNLSDDQKSYLRGKRYNLEKQSIPNREGNNQHRVVEDHCDPQPKPSTAERLAQEYHVSQASIKRDGQYAEAVDTLVEALGPEVRQEVLAGHTKLPKHKIVKSAQAVRRLKRRLQPEDFSFMRGLPRGFHQDALRLLTELPADEHALVDSLLDQPGLPAREMLEVILRRFPAQPPDARQAIYALDASTDPRDHARALREAAGGTPIPPPLLRFLEQAGAGLVRAMKHLDQCVQLHPTAPWVARLQDIIAQMQALHMGTLVQALAEVQSYFEGGPEADVHAEEATDHAKDGDAASDQEIPEPEPAHDSAAVQALTLPLGVAADATSQAPAGLATAVPPCGWCGFKRTRRLEASDRIYCDRCHAFYDVAVGFWSSGFKEKRRRMRAPGPPLS